MELIALCAILAIPVTIAVLAWRDEHVFRALMEAQADSIDRLLQHAAETQAPGEPASLTKAKLAVAAKDVEAKVAVARLRAAGGGFDPLQES